MNKTFSEAFIQLSQVAVPVFRAETDKLYKSSAHSPLLPFNIPLSRTLQPRLHVYYCAVSIYFYADLCQTRCYVI